MVTGGGPYKVVSVWTLAGETEPAWGVMSPKGACAGVIPKSAWLARLRAAIRKCSANRAYRNYHRGYYPRGY